MQCQECEHQNQRYQCWKHRNAIDYLTFYQQFKRTLKPTPRTFYAQIFLIETRNIKIVTNGEHQTENQNIENNLNNYCYRLSCAHSGNLCHCFLLSGSVDNKVEHLL